MLFKLIKSKRLTQKHFNKAAEIAFILRSQHKRANYFICKSNCPPINTKSHSSSPFEPFILFLVDTFCNLKRIHHYRIQNSSGRQHIRNIKPLTAARS